MRRRLLTLAAAATLLGSAPTASAQTWSVDDPVLRAIWDQGMNRSQVMRIAQTLMDSIGPRLTGTPGSRNAVDWAVKTLQSWGAEARAEQYGTWHGWRRGVTHVDLLQPRVRTLEGTMLAWSPGTGRQPVQAQVIHAPAFASPAEYEAWLPNVRGRIVAVAYPQPTCRPLRHYETFGATFPPNPDAPDAPRTAAEALQQRRTEARTAFTQHRPRGDFRLHMERAGAVAVLESNWSNDLGVNKIFGTETTSIPTIDLSCEDYGLVYRLAANNQGPVVRISAESQDLGTVPVFNVIGIMRGSELPNEYVMLSAHFDSWDGASGATDNGTGSSMMLEAIRILRQTYPNPKRTIMIGLWGGEEQGLNGSRRFVAMHPEIVEGMQALFNQDNGTGRIERISMSGFVNAGEAFGRWLARIPQQISGQITLQMPGQPGTGGTDHVSFLCAGAPAFSLGGVSWDYGTATWHTNRDTFDKVVEEDIRSNATLAAMLVYLASEDPQRVSREKRHMGDIPWPPCRPGAATSPRAGG